MIIDNKFTHFKENDNIINSRYGHYTIIKPYLLYDNHRRCHVIAECDCGTIKTVNLYNLKHGISTSCGHCYDNKYEVINNYVSILKIYNKYIEYWDYILINTNCIEYLKTCGRWRINKILLSDMVTPYFSISTTVNHSETVLLSRVIVQYINSKYNLPPLSDDLQIDHISGNTFNNLYYPFNDEISKYYNNLRVCTQRQNGLNRPCIGFRKRPINKKYETSIHITPQITKYKSFSSPQECINYNISQLSDIDKQYYYHSPSNPRNNPNTFSNTILNAIGYNDNEYEYTDDDFNE